MFPGLLRSPDRRRRVAFYRDVYRGPVETASTADGAVEEFTGPLAGLITKAIPDLTTSFDTFADGLKAAAEAEAVH